MKASVKLVKHLQRGDVIRTPDEFLDPMEDASEHVVVEVLATDDGCHVQVEPNPFTEHWRLNPDESLFVLREGAEVETPRTVEIDLPPAPVEPGPADGDDPLEAFGLARARLRALGYVLGSVRLSTMRAGDVLMVSGAGTMLAVESIDGQIVKFAKTEPAMRLDPGATFVCLRPVRA